MGMPCEINSIVKLHRSQDYPAELLLDRCYRVVKSGYRILPMDVPLPLVDEQWLAYADVVVQELCWRDRETHLTFRVHRLYPQPWSMKGEEIAHRESV